MLGIVVEIVKGIGGHVAIALYAMVVCMGAVAGTCTQGDDDRFYASLIYAIPLFFLALWGITCARMAVIRYIYLLALILMCMAVCFFWGPLVWQTTVLGHHLCGAGFDQGLAFNEGVRVVMGRMIPLIHVSMAGGLVIYAYQQISPCTESFSTGTKR